MAASDSKAEGAHDKIQWLGGHSELEASLPSRNDVDFLENGELNHGNLLIYQRVAMKNIVFPQLCDTNKWQFKERG